MTERPVIEDLSDALSAFDWPQAQKICDDLIARLNLAATPFPEESARHILDLLRRKSRFTLMALVADAFIRTGQSSPQIFRQYAQAMIDQGNLTAARMVLGSIIADPEAQPAERAEASGLLGRIYKQLYVKAANPSNQRQQENLRQGIRCYYDVYQTEPKAFLWHGINTVALLARALRDGVPVAGFPAAQQISMEINGLLGQVRALQSWDRATAIENAVALGDLKTAYDHVVHYVSDPAVDAFEIRSLLRQFTEVWQLSLSVEPGITLLPTLQAALLRREGGTLTVQPAGLNAKANRSQDTTKGFEKIFGAARYQPLAWYKTGLNRCQAVARIESITGFRIGTGFLVRRADFFSSGSEKELLLLTNAHVISTTDMPFPGAIPPEAARAVFEGSGKTYNVKGLVWSSPPTELDATFVSLDQIEETAELCPLVPSPEPFDRSKQQRVYVIGYPLGGGLSISLQDSVWLDTDSTLLHYRTPTDPGSSGSPIFDQHYWTIIGLHHAGEKDMPRLNGQTGTYEANEGILISAIRKATRGAVSAGV